MARFAQLALEDLGRGELAERIAPYRAGYTPQQRRELERRLVDGRAARRRLDRRARARHRHRLARRGDLRDVPRHGRLAAPDVGPRRAPRPRAGGLRRRRGRARPVLLPPSRRVPRPARRGGDPRPDNEQIHAAHVLCAAHEGPLEPADAEFLGDGAASCTAERLEAAGELRRRPGGTYVPRDAGDYPAGAVSLRSTAARRLLDRRRRARASCSAPSTPRARSTRRTRARSTCTAGARSRSTRSTSSCAARSSGRSRATGTRRPSARPTCTSSGCSTGASGSA